MGQTIGEPNFSCEGIKMRCQMPFLGQLSSLYYIRAPSGSKKKKINEKKKEIFHNIHYITNKRESTSGKIIRLKVLVHKRHFIKSAHFIVKKGTFNFHDFEKKAFFSYEIFFSFFFFCLKDTMHCFPKLKSRK